MVSFSIICFLKETSHAGFQMVQSRAIEATSKERHAYLHTTRKFVVNVDFGRPKDTNYLDFKHEFGR